MFKYIWLKLIAIFLCFKQFQSEDIASNLFFVFVPQSVPYNVSISINEPEELLKQDGFQLNRTTIMYLGGHNQTNNIQLMYEVLSAYLELGTYNVLHLDVNAYSEVLDNDEFWNVTPEICRDLAVAILKLVELGISPGDIQLVGHSWGATASRIIGYYTGSQLGELVELDPPPPSGRANELEIGDDAILAQYSIIIYTDRGRVSSTTFSAAVNYIVNNGTRCQPGCSESGCSHLRAAPLWSNILLHPDLFLAVHCNETACDYNSVSKVGPDVRIYGNYYFRTSGTEPFGIGLQGIDPPR